MSPRPGDPRWGRQAPVARIEGRHWWYAARRSMLRRAARRLPAGRAVDVGAGTGGTTEVLARLGWDVVAVEPEPEAALLCARRGLPTVRADGTSLSFADEVFALAVAMDVLEHVEDDAALVREALRVLRPGGTFFVTVPAGQDLWSAHDEAEGHHRRYDAENLRRMLEEAGFEVVRITPWMVALRPVVAWRRAKTERALADLRRHSAPVNLALRAVVEGERFLPLAKRGGVSLVAVARRPG